MAIKKYWKYLLFMGSIALIIIGALGGEMGTLFQKAILICLECIGVA